MFIILKHSKSGHFSQSNSKSILQLELQFDKSKSFILIQLALNETKKKPYLIQKMKVIKVSYK